MKPLLIVITGAILIVLVFGVCQYCSNVAQANHAQAEQEVNDCFNNAIDTGTSADLCVMLANQLNQ